MNVAPRIVKMMHEMNNSDMVEKAAEMTLYAMTDANGMSAGPSPSHSVFRCSHRPCCLLLPCCLPFFIARERRDLQHAEPLSVRPSALRYKASRFGSNGVLECFRILADGSS